ncbi:MAG: hypothetical protein K2X31_10025, partial [Sphingopyxis sp.]|nr:hypothetical protein [Sphingopyxis sp.]
MKKLCIAACMALFCSPLVIAADTKGDKEPTAQQNRMTECNKKASDKKGEERKEFMSACLSGKEPEPKMTPQQTRMKECNEKAGSRKGDDRKSF